MRRGGKSKKRKSKGLFKKGFKPVVKQLMKRSKYVMSCESCKYLYKGEGDDEELCQNSNVTEWDMITDERAIYCTYWTPCGEVESDKRKSVSEYVSEKYGLRL
mgnify:CR=1 FL=1